MKRKELPILSTHVANIALNKAIALHFLLSGAQRTNGFTEYSHESYINDKLHVALWMIYEFTNLDDEKPIEPWIKLSEWEMPESSMDGADTIHEFDEILEKISQEAKSAGTLWDKQNPKAISFLNKIIAQVKECIWYTNQRLTAIRVCAQMGPMGEDNPEAILNGGPKLAEKIMSNPMAMMAGYLLIKNERNSKKILAYKLLIIILSFLIEKAVLEGYTMPSEEFANQ